MLVQCFTYVAFLVYVSGSILVDTWKVNKRLWSSTRAEALPVAIDMVKPTIADVYGGELLGWQSSQDSSSGPVAY